jgi:hypothetical protein
MTSAPDTFYVNDPECMASIFDLREPDAAAALHRQRARWAEYSALEALDEDHFVLVVRPGWVREAVA